VLFRSITETTKPVPGGFHNATTFTVRFPAAVGSPAIKSVDVVVEMPSSRAAVPFDTLSATARSAIGRTPSVKPTYADGFLELRDVIKAQLNADEITFMFDHNAKAMRVSELNVAPRAVAHN